MPIASRHRASESKKKSSESCRLRAVKCGRPAKRMRIAHRIVEALKSDTSQEPKTKASASRRSRFVTSSHPAAKQQGALGVHHRCFERRPLPLELALSTLLHHWHAALRPVRNSIAASFLQERGVPSTLSTAFTAADEGIAPACLFYGTCCMSYVMHARPGASDKNLKTP